MMWIIELIHAFAFFYHAKRWLSELGQFKGQVVRFTEMSWRVALRFMPPD
jgi:hypothetical protein